MDLIGRHRRDRDEHDWEARRGRFTDCDPDTPDRPQVMPGRRPDRPEDETHNLGADGARQREDAERDGPWRAGGGDDGS